MTKKSIIQSIKTKEMDRKDFLKYSGLAFAALLGFKAVISLLVEPDKQKTAVDKRSESSRGFGNGRYGV